MLRERFRDRPLLCLPTGSGKTSVAAEIIRSAVAKGRRCIFLVHRRELVDQAVSRLAEYGVPAGRILAAEREARDLPVQVASIPTLIRRKHWPAQLVIVDECSHAVSASWSDVLDRYADAWVIGLTATPIRLDGRGLGDIFGCIVEPVTTRRLIEQGHLIEPKVFAPPVDLKGVSIRAGDYSIPELAERMGGLTGSITRTWMERAVGQRTVVFAVNVDHSERIVAAFRLLGVRAAHIDGGTANTTRAATLAALRSGELEMVSNCMVLSEGWDLPSLQCAILARPTKSLALFRQMVGRVMRPPGPVLVLDHAGNHHEHGCVTDEIPWSLETRPKKQGPPPLRTCPECYAVVALAATSCPECGAIFEGRAEAARPKVENPGALIEFNRSDSLEQKEAFYREVVRQASLTKRKLGFARHRYRIRYGVWPKLYALEREEYRCAGHEFEAVTHGWKRVQKCKRCLCEIAAGSVPPSAPPFSTQRTAPPDSRPDSILDYIDRSNPGFTVEPGD